MLWTKIYFLTKLIAFWRLESRDQGTIHSSSHYWKVFCDIYHCCGNTLSNNSHYSSHHLRYDNLKILEDISKSKRTWKCSTVSHLREIPDFNNNASCEYYLESLWSQRNRVASNPVHVKTSANSSAENLNGNEKGALMAGGHRGLRGHGHSPLVLTPSE